MQTPQGIIYGVKVKSVGRYLTGYVLGIYAPFLYTFLLVATPRSLTMPPQFYIWLAPICVATLAFTLIFWPQFTRLVAWTTCLVLGLWFFDITVSIIYSLAKIGHPSAIGKLFQLTDAIRLVMYEAQNWLFVIAPLALCACVAAFLSPEKEIPSNSAFQSNEQARM